MSHPACRKKLTEGLNFGKALDGIPKDVEKFVHDATRKRDGVVEALKSVDGSSETMINTLKEYVAMTTTLKSILEKVKRYSRLRFKWSNLLDDEKTVTNDVDREMVSMMFAAALWHMEHAQWLTKSVGNEEENEEQMKRKLNSLKAAASIFEAAKSWPNSLLGSIDLKAQILDALSLQSVAEGQSITIRRAISKNHKASLISELCCDVSNKYNMAAGEVNGSSQEGQKWASYMKFQGETYMALARAYQGVHLLETEERCGESIVVLSQGLRHIDQAVHLAKEYDKIKPKTKLNLDETPQFQKVKKLLEEKKAKSERENGLIYHAKIPEECPPPLEPKCVVQITALALPTGEDLTSVVTEAADANPPEGKKEDEDTSAS
ncbi:BRO1 domain-containing protein BROX-like [Acropora millepora]|uniref:BRO1 domain-containing protein BROX-like n=1 Tax=Acropora millepora TaxID=45264 RepID=UPI001CF13AAF|nr:BRO1 domain-containing protein BROX-like [Acropora millepora]